LSKHRSLIVRKLDWIAILVQLFIDVFGIWMSFKHSVVGRLDLVFVIEFFLEVIIEVVVEVLFIEIIEGIWLVVFPLGCLFIGKIILVGLIVFVTP
jgi:hypothetical protein